MVRVAPWLGSRDDESGTGREGVVQGGLPGGGFELDLKSWSVILHHKEG